MFDVQDFESGPARVDIDFWAGGDYNTARARGIVRSVNSQSAAAPARGEFEPGPG